MSVLILLYVISSFCFYFCFYSSYYFFYSCFNSFSCVLSQYQSCCTLFFSSCFESIYYSLFYLLLYCRFKSFTAHDLTPSTTALLTDMNTHSYFFLLSPDFSPIFNFPPCTPAYILSVIRLSLTAPYCSISYSYTSSFFTPGTTPCTTGASAPICLYSSLFINRILLVFLLIFSISFSCNSLSNTNYAFWKRTWQCTAI